MKTIKGKATISFDVEYDIYRNDYPDDFTLDQIIENEKLAIIEDPNAHIDGEAKVELKLIMNKKCGVCGDEYIGEYLDSGLCEDCKW